MAASVSNAQTFFGAKSGIMISSGGSETQSNASLYAGGFVELRRENWSLQSEVNYLDVGSRGRSRITVDETIESTTKIKQVNFSLLAKYYISDLISIKAGGYYGTIISSERIASSPKYEGMKLSGKYKPSDYGIETGIEFLISNGIFADAKYSFGIADLNNNYKNRIISLGIGCKF